MTLTQEVGVPRQPLLERRGRRAARTDAGLVGRDQATWATSAIDGIYHGDTRHVRDADADRAAMRRLEWISLVARGRVTRRCSAGSCAALDDQTARPEGAAAARPSRRGRLESARS